MGDHHFMTSCSTPASEASWGAYQTFTDLYVLDFGAKVLPKKFSPCQVPQFDGDLGQNIFHKNVSYDKKSYTTTNGMD